MATLTVVDASVLIGWLDDHDPHHGAAIEVLAAVDRFVVHTLTVLTEPVALARLRAVASTH